MKYIGLLLIFSGMSYAGYLLSLAYRKELQQFGGYHQFCMQLKSEMETGKTELLRALEVSATKYLTEPMKSILLDMVSRLQNYQETDFMTAWEEGISKIKMEPGNYLDEEEMTFMTDLGKILCENQHYFGHWEQLSLHTQQVTQYHENMIKTMPSKQKISLQLGICMGGLLVIMLF